MEKLHYLKEKKQKANTKKNEEQNDTIYRHAYLLSSPYNLINRWELEKQLGVLQVAE